MKKFKQAINEAYKKLQLSEIFNTNFPVKIRSKNNKRIEA